MGKSEVESSRRVSRRNRKSVKKKGKPKEVIAGDIDLSKIPEITTREQVLTSSEERKQSTRGKLLSQWSKRPKPLKLSPSAAEVEKFKKDYELWQMEMDKLLK